jgi:CDGSH-type Zn-finger protein/mannose-6-phosphate isomerase-like protein (cupin superfamily)
VNDPAEPIVARYKPYYEELEGGKSYLWCACGRSKTQPHCDGSHRGTGIVPVKYRAKEGGEEVLFCGCKHTADQPFCDGAHNNLKDTYDTDDPNAAEYAGIPVVSADKDAKARLDGGCFVCSVPQMATTRQGTLSWGPIITAADGANHQSQFYFLAEPGMGPVTGFGDRHVVMLVTAGDGEVDIGGRRFAISLNTGVYVRPGELFQLHATETLSVFVSVGPLADAPEWHDSMAETFDAAHPNRTIGIDENQRQTMANRFFQMLVDKSLGSDLVTQFIGEIPLSKAVPHRHLYEESLVVIKGKGFMWTENGKAAVNTGDVIFLPRKQIHSLECTDPDGMFVAGLIYPGDNPSINY